MKFWLSRYDPPPIPIFRQALKQRGDCARSDVFGAGVVSAKMLRLRDLLYGLALFPSDQKTERRKAEAAALAHELFPPMAKPLAWEWDASKDEWFSGEYRCARTYRMATPQIKSPCFSARYKGINIDGKTFDSAREAKVFAEQHHQQTFKDQLA